MPNFLPATEAPLVFERERSRSLNKPEKPHRSIVRLVERLQRGTAQTLAVGQGLLLELINGHINSRKVDSPLLFVLQADASTRYAGGAIKDPQEILRAAAMQLASDGRYKAVVFFRDSRDSLTALYFADLEMINNFLEDHQGDDLDLSEPLFSMENSKRLASRVAEIVAENTAQRTVLKRRVGDQVVNITPDGKVVEVLGEVASTK